MSCTTSLRPSSVASSIRLSFIILKSLKGVISSPLPLVNFNLVISGKSSCITPLLVGIGLEESSVG
jgi:hypothetical protein